ncbi:MAG: hypothetical protein N3G21_07790 [Candidatus Hydrogenedentes bacterium]|nr:hypothetical protein [Candidatus Hydrogenedentota bacterium]
MLIVSVISFISTLVLILFITGNFSRESLIRLWNRGESQPFQVYTPATANSEDELTGLIEQIKKKEEELRKKEEELNRKEQELKNVSQQLQELQSQIELSQNELTKKLGEDVQERDARIRTIAITLAEMKPDKAAERLKTMSPDEIAEILSYVKPKERGKIVEAMDAQLASQVLQSLQKVKPGKSTL